MTCKTLRRLGAIALTALVAIGATALPAAAQSDMSDEERARIEGVVRDYLMKNPEVIAEAIAELRRRTQQAQVEQRREIVDAITTAMADNPGAPVGGNPDGDITIVEFFDYRCGYCKKAYGDMMSAVEADGNTRIVFLEYPIFGGLSLTAARAGLAAEMQGKYLAYHNAIITAKGDLTEQMIWDLAAKAGLDVKRLKADMNDPSIDAQLAANQRMASDLQLSGTPAFLVGNQFVGGAISADQFTMLIKAMRQHKG